MRVDGHTLTRGVALAGFLAVAGWLSRELPAWSEGRSVYPAQAGGSVWTLVDGEVRAEPTCARTDEWTLRSVDRPHWRLCVGRLSLPLMITPYASGVAYWPSALLWPLHEGDLRRLRWWGLLLGLLSILVSARLVERAAGREVGTVATVTLAVTSPLLVLSALLVHYEVTPWLFLAAAAAIAPPDPPWTARRAAAVGLLLGLAIGANIKALFLLVPLALLRWRLRGTPRVSLERRAAVVGALACLLALTPNLAHLFVDAGEGFGGQIDQRLAALARNLHPRRFGEELLNLAWFWGDMTMYFDAAAGRTPRPSAASLLVVVPCLLHSLVVAVRVIGRGRADDGLQRWTAACGVLLATFVAVSALLYDQFPAANHSPLFAVFGLAVATSLARLLRVIEPKLGARRWALLPLVAALLLHATVHRGAPTRYLALPIDLAAEVEAAAFLRERAPARPTLSATYNYAGIFDSLGAGPVDRAHRVLGEASAGPLAARVRALLDHQPGAFDLIVPARAVPIDEPFVAELPATLRAQAQAAGREVEVVFEGRGRTTQVLLRVLRVGPAPAAGG